MRIWQRIKKVLNNFLAKMEEANKQAFKGKPLDCCSLNRPGPGIKKG